MSQIHHKRITGLITQYMNKFPIEADAFDEVRFAQFLVEEIVPGVTPSTWRAYKSSCRKYIKSDVALTILNDAVAPPKKLLKRKTSSMRAKKVSDKDFTLLSDFAKHEYEKDTRSHGYVAIRWLRLAMLTGLRPHEWLCARLEGSTLYIKNKKLNLCTDEEWADRYFDIGYLSKTDQMLIADFLGFMHIKDELGEGEERLDKLRKRATAWLRKANMKLFPRRKLSITLMSGRHQFIANLKVSKRYSPAEIAYLVGHASDLRAFESYGRTANGTSNVKLPEITEEQQQDVAKVKLHHAAKVAKMKKGQRYQGALNSQLEIDTSSDGELTY